jgi:hypothetical protein
MQDAQDLISGGLNAAAMCCFATEGGAPVGAGLIVLSTILDAMWPPPNPPAGVAQQIAGSLNKLRSDIAVLLANKSLDEIIDHGDSRFTTLETASKQVRQLLLSPGSLGRQQVDPTVTAMDKYFELKTAGYDMDIFVTARNHLEIDSLNYPQMSALEAAGLKIRTAGLYCFIGSYLASYLKTATTWGWGYRIACNKQNELYNDDVTDWRSHDQNYQNQHPFGNLITPYPGLPLPSTSWPTNWQTYSSDVGGPVQALKDELNHMLSYCASDTDKGDMADGLYTLMWKHWKDLDKQMASYRTTVVPNMGIAVSDMTTACDNGFARGAKWEELNYQYAFEGPGWVLAEDDLYGFAATLDVWRSVLASVDFQTYTVDTKKVPPDTFASIAKLWPPNTPDTIFQNNFEIFPATDTGPNDQSLQDGMILKMYTAAAMPYLVTKLVPLQAPTQGQWFHTTPELPGHKKHQHRDAARDTLNTAIS